MKNITWLLLLVLFLSYIFGNDILLSKFHQNGYKVKDIRNELISYNENFYNFFEVKTFKYNRTTPAINATFKMKITVKDKVEVKLALNVSKYFFIVPIINWPGQLRVVVQGLKFLSNEYRHFPIRFQVNLKKSVDSNALGSESMKQCGNITSVWFEKDITYHSCNVVLDEAHFPPLMPDGRFKFNFVLLYLNEEIASLDLFFEVYTIIPYPKK